MANPPGRTGYPIAPAVAPARCVLAATIVAMARVYVVLLMIHLALLVVALFDCLSCDRHAVRAVPQRTWVFVILLTAPIGAIAWFVKGQPAPPIRLADGTVLRAGAPAGPPRPAVLGPDDDPDFLQRLTAEMRRRAEEK